MTIYDIAKEAGVSASTVSRIINNKSGINKKTREKVQLLLDKYNFSVSEQARALVNKKAMMIAILISDIRNLHYTEGAYIIERMMLEKGYCSLIINTGSKAEDMASSIKTISARRVDGAVLIGSSFANDEVKNAISVYMKDVPICFENGSLDLENVYSVLADDKKGAFDAASYLMSSGRKNIAYINNSDTPSNRLKIEGYKEAVGSDAIVINADEDSPEGSCRITKEVLESRPDIDAIIYSVDLFALSAERTVLDMGLKIPEDVAIIGFDNSPYSYLANPKLSSVDTMLSSLSEECAHTLLKLIEKEEVEKSVTFPPLLVLRETT